MSGSTPFKTGDVVQPKSGGPKLTVIQLKGELVSCCWFDAALHLQAESLAPELLDLVTRKELRVPG